MSNQFDSAGETIKAALSELAEDYVEARYYECLVGACILFTRVKDDRNSPASTAAMEFMRQCIAHLIEGSDGVDTTKKNVSCSFCEKSPPEIRLGAGPAVFICNECVDVFHNIL
jgi:hypothetical protein